MSDRSSTIDRSDVDEAITALRRRAGVTVITPDDDGYDAARTVFYGGVGGRPAVIARPTDSAGAAAVIGVARDHDLPLAVRSGGHGLLGHAAVDGSIVLDLRDLDDLTIDAADRTAWVGAGMTAGAYTDAVGAHGLATGFGDTGSVGIGGLTVGGGMGLLTRKLGLTIDQLLAAEVVTADGTIRVVDAETHPDLFWAIRGGGGTIAVVTRFRFQRHEVPSVVGGMLILPSTPEVLHGFITAAGAAPEELTTILGVASAAPPLPFLPPAVHGKPVMMALLAYAGPDADAERVLDPFLSLTTPLHVDVGPRPYAELFPHEEQAGPTGVIESAFLDEVDLAVARLILDRLDRATSPVAMVQLRVLGGRCHGCRPTPPRTPTATGASSPSPPPWSSTARTPRPTGPGRRRRCGRWHQPEQAAT